MLIEVPAHTKHIGEQTQLAQHIFCSLLDQLVMLENNREIDYWSWLSIPGEIMINNLPSAPAPLITDIIETTLHIPAHHHTWQNKEYFFLLTEVGVGWLTHHLQFPGQWGHPSPLTRPRAHHEAQHVVWREEWGHTGSNTWYWVFSTRGAGQLYNKTRSDTELDNP